VRGIELVFELEQGELLAEPMPNRDARTGFLFYEATEGGAGVLTRLVAEPSKLAEVAREALAVLHFALDDKPSLPTDATQLLDRGGTSCVAACYKCLLSYYNQPDHETLDRRDLNARTVLLRLARSTTRAVTGAPAPGGADEDDPLRAALAARGIAMPDTEPLAIGEQRLKLVWRDHYVVAVIGEVDPALVLTLADRGFEIVRLADDRSTMTLGLDALAKLLGR
jgi:hypothetical protein